MSTGTILDQIIDWKRIEVARAQERLPLEAVQQALEEAPQPRDLGAALAQPGVSLIAEVKRASPSKGVLRENLDPGALARIYQDSGAAAISVLTDRRFFRATLDDLRAFERRSTGRCCARISCWNPTKCTRPAPPAPMPCC